MKPKKKEDFSDLEDLKSVYIWGSPGSGKSFITDLFYESLDLQAKKKRMHYNEFMLEIHQEEHKVNQKLKGFKGSGGDTIAVVGDNFCKDLLLFYIDEF